MVHMSIFSAANPVYFMCLIVCESVTLLGSELSDYTDCSLGGGAVTGIVS